MMSSLKKTHKKSKMFDCVVMVFRIILMVITHFCCSNA